jgi:aminocarboxymuconate-semialdehyde decarboxylase
MIVDGELGANVSRSFNSAVGRVLKDYPGKFIGVAPVPLQDPERAIEELEYAIHTLGLYGVIIYQNVNGKDLHTHRGGSGFRIELMLFRRRHSQTVSTQSPS